MQVNKMLVFGKIKLKMKNILLFKKFESFKLSKQSEAIIYAYYKKQ